MTLDLDVLFKVAEASPELDKAEALLRQGGHADLADRLVKFQQDCGLDIDREMGGDWDEPAPGPESAALRAAYQPTSLERLQVLAEVINILPPGTVSLGFELPDQGSGRHVSNLDNPAP